MRHLELGFQSVSLVLLQSYMSLNMTLHCPALFHLVPVMNLQTEFSWHLREEELPFLRTHCVSITAFVLVIEGLSHLGDTMKLHPVPSFQGTESLPHTAQGRAVSHRLQSAVFIVLTRLSEGAFSSGDRCRNTDGSQLLHEV